LVDNARNVIVVAGTPDEIDNYSRTIHTFDVDWLRGMSVGVFNLQHANVEELMPQLDGMFGPKGDTPLAGMFRFIPIKRTNALVVISTQPSYLSEIRDWIAKIDLGGGNEPQLYVYDVRNIGAADMAHYLAQIYADNSGGSSDHGGSVAPGAGGATTLGVGNNASGNTSGMGSTAGSFGSSTTGGTSGGLSSGLGSTGTGNSSYGGLGSSSSNTGGIGGGTAVNGVGMNGGLASTQNQDQGYSSKDGSIRIGSVSANNQLLVRARPAQWQEMLGVIRQLDMPPLQVQIEAKVFEVQLTGNFQFGVQWYLQGLAGTTDDNGTITPGNPYSHRMIGLGGGIGNQGTYGGNSYSGQPFFYSFLSSNGKFQVAVNALETSENTKTLSAPTLVVLNNQIAHIQVGNQVPVNQTYYTGLGTGTGTTVGEVQYIPTGIILDVQPRVNPGGLIYLNIDQQVSATNGQNSQGNYTISQRQIATQLSVQNGQTVLLGGLIQQQNSDQNAGVPGLSRIPILGKLFGSTSKNKTRDELIVLITPRVISNSDEAKQITDEYQDQFQSLAPLRGHKAPPLEYPLRR
ncbi:MAG TPA: type II secretion system secretin GspD, partial [Dyella sp.]|uniref:type II secretion system secretin GspD n=1 Tax=Dyella sp. TaxID=1869338 RepID=UPI002CAD0088